ncbi:hypothetical protein EJ06DRAFT_110332 [Trichodelitschia bisporula]|uniref:Uncharacterized protein n=1 Tax=Trichodelitschia bisporula TaxID=703511 RepID=A0A6G1HR34_9PEZI|nr:hypothetical protein EJ06DRAFT_110332 [Trichodelitschia bisporula]
MSDSSPSTWTVKPDSKGRPGRCMSAFARYQSLHLETQNDHSHFLLLLLPVEFPRHRSPLSEPALNLQTPHYLLQSSNSSIEYLLLLPRSAPWHANPAPTATKPSPMKTLSINTCGISTASTPISKTGQQRQRHVPNAKRHSGNPSIRRNM